MRVSRPTHAAHTAAILAEASRLFRAQGIDGVAVADITRAAGLTHGAFYGHFPSKAALAADAVQDAMHQSALRVRAIAAEARRCGQDPLDTIITRYLSAWHRDNRDQGCMLAALEAELTRDAALGATLHAGTSGLLLVLAEEITARHPGCTPAQAQSGAIGVLSVLVGGLQLARTAVTDPLAADAALSQAARVARLAADALPPL